MLSENHGERIARKPRMSLPESQAKRATLRAGRLVCTGVSFRFAPNGKEVRQDASHTPNARPVQPLPPDKSPNDRMIQFGHFVNKATRIAVPPMFLFEIGVEVVMDGQRKTLYYLVAAQAACLALGIWIHHQFLLSSASCQEKGTEARSATVVDQQPRKTEFSSVSQSTSSPVSVNEGNNILQAMPLANGIAFVWIAGLQSAVAFLVFSRVQTEHARRQMHSRERSLQQTHDLIRTRDAVIFGLAKLAESRDPDTGHHLERIAHYSTRLAKKMSQHPGFRDQITASFTRLIGISSALHDIGKVGVEDAILLKPGKLTEDERFHMELHSAVGGECIREIEQRLGNSNFLHMAREIALFHHERWDGAGYPKGLQAEEIPLSARIVAVADVYDALASRRVYKGPFPHEKCVAIIRDASGSQFDPRIVEVFLSIEHEFQAIAQQFVDSDGAIDVQAFDAEPATDTVADISRMTNDQERVLAFVLEAEECCRKTIKVG